MSNRIDAKLADDGYHQRSANTSRRVRVSSMGATAWSNPDAIPKRLFLTSFMVDHPFLVHFIVMGIAVLVTILNPDKKIPSMIEIAAIIPDYSFWSDGFHADLAIKEKLKAIHSTGEPQRGVDEVCEAHMFQDTCCLVLGEVVN